MGFTSSLLATPAWERLAIWLLWALVSLTALTMLVFAAGIATAAVHPEWFVQND